MFDGMPGEQLTLVLGLVEHHRQIRPANPFCQRFKISTRMRSRRDEGRRTGCGVERVEIIPAVWKISEPAKGEPVRGEIEDECLLLLWTVPSGRNIASVSRFQTKTKVEVGSL